MESGVGWGAPSPCRRPGAWHESWAFRAARTTRRGCVCVARLCTAHVHGVAGGGAWGCLGGAPSAAWRMEAAGGCTAAAAAATAGAQNSILHAGKDSSCITTVLLLARTMMPSSCCFSCVCWYHSRVTAVSCVGMRVT